MESAGKVLIIVQNLPVPFDRRVWLEATTLKESGYHVSVICPTGKDGKFQESYQVLDGVHIYRYFSPSEAHNTMGYVYEFIYCWLMTAFLSLKVLFQQGFDIIHACNPPETYFFLAWFYKPFGKKFLFDHHDLSPEMYEAKGGSKTGLLYKGLLWLEKLTFKTADVVITTNQSHKDIAIQRGRVTNEKIFIVRSGPDFNRLKVLDPEPALKDGYPYLVCYLGEMCEQDGVDRMLYAVKYLWKNKGRKDVKVVFMGGGPELEKLRQLKQDLNLNDFVEFKGRVSDHDLCRYLSTADVCIDPDPYTEWANQSTMNKIMEYMTFGKPIVAFDLKEHRFSAHDAAVYATPNRIEELAELTNDLLNNPEQRQKMGKIGVERVHNQLSWDYSAQILLAAYVYLFQGKSKTEYL